MYIKFTYENVWKQIYTLALLIDTKLSLHWVKFCPVCIFILSSRVKQVIHCGRGML